MKNPTIVEKVVINNSVEGGGSIATDDSAYTWYPKVPANAAVVALTTDTTLTVATHMGKNLTNTGAGGTAVFTLPTALSCKGKSVRASALAAQIIRFLPQTGESIYLNGSGVATKYLNIPATIGSWATVTSDGTQWLVTEANGIITKEA